MFDSLLADTVELTGSELEERIRSNELERRRIDVEQAALIAVAEHRRLFDDDGHRSMSAYLRATLNCSSGEASRLRGAARAVDRIDGLGEAWLTGRLGESQVAQFAKLHSNRRVRDQLATVAPLLLEQAEQLPHRDFVACAQRFVQLADLDGAHDNRDDAMEHRNAGVVDVGGMLDVSAHGGDGITTAEMIAIFEAFRDREFQRDVETRRVEHGDDADGFPLPRTARQRSFDALVSIFRAAVTAEHAGTPVEPAVNILIDAQTWTDLLAACGLIPGDGTRGDAGLIPTLVGGDVPLTDRRCETSTGVRLHPHDVLRAALAGHVRRVVVDSGGVVIDLGRRQRLFTGAARDAAMLLVRHCEHPGCHLPAGWCDVDHGSEWAAGGRTDQANAGIRCGHHNVLKTRRRWSTKRDVRGRHHTIRADGSVIIPVGARRPSFPDDDPDEHTPDEIARLEQRIRNRVRALRAA